MVALIDISLVGRGSLAKNLRCRTRLWCTRDKRSDKSETKYYTTDNNGVYVVSWILIDESGGFSKTGIEKCFICFKITD